ncbi:uncharacterized protein LOC110844409 [Folsomia candida]|uniref:uncharacterized protein LOC110844409 n=1 Tax=Folsomia candida TaxID=158441 RepID=UPI000B8F5882|nr:uncharacterized protein LOC110844409 [Folsomia candida]
MRTKRGALATTTKATRTSRTSMAARKTPPEDEGGDGAPQKKMRNLSPPENPIVDTPIPQSGDMSKQLEQIMTKFMTDEDLKTKLRRTFQTLSAERQPCVEEGGATPNSTVEEMIVLVDPSTVSSTATPTHDDEDDDVPLISDNEVYLVSEDVDNEVVVPSGSNTPPPPSGESVVAPSPDPIPASPMEGIRIRNDLFEPEDAELTAIFEDLKKKSKLIMDSVNKVIDKFQRSFNQSETTVAEKLKNFHDIQTSLSLSIGILDVSNVKLQINEHYLSQAGQDRFAYGLIQRIATEEMGEYFLKLIAITIFLKVPACDLFATQITIIHYRVCRLLNYYAILEGGSDPETTLQNILLAIMPDVRRYNVSAEAIARTWDKVSMFHLRATYVKHSVLYDQTNLGFLGFGRQLDAILIKVKEMVYRERNMPPPPQRASSTFSFEDDMYSFYEITGVSLEVVPPVLVSSATNTLHRNGQPTTTSVNMNQSPMSMLMQGCSMTSEDVFRTPTSRPVQMAGYCPIPTSAPTGLQNIIIRPSGPRPMQMMGYSPFQSQASMGSPNILARPPTTQMVGYFPIPSSAPTASQNSVARPPTTPRIIQICIRGQAPGQTGSQNILARPLTPQMVAYSPIRIPVPTASQNNVDRPPTSQMITAPSPAPTVSQNRMALPPTPRPTQIRGQAPGQTGSQNNMAQPNHTNSLPTSAAFFAARRTNDTTNSPGGARSASSSSSGEVRPTSNYPRFLRQ